MARGGACGATASCLRASAGSPFFVEWRREDDQWVVSAFGDEDIYFPHLLGRTGPFSRDTAGVPEDAAFAQADWHTITIEGWRGPKYGIPRPIDRALLARIGVLHRVSVYVDRDESRDTAEVLYLPVAPGRYQAYERPLGRDCDRRRKVRNLVLRGGGMHLGRTHHHGTRRAPDPRPARTPAVTPAARLKERGI